MRSSRLTVEREGVLTLPADLCEAAGLRPGDVLAVEALDDSFILEVYRQLLDGALDYMDDDALLGFAVRFLSRPLTALEPGGHLRIPGDTFQLPAGSRMRAFLDRPGHRMQFFREPPDPPCGEGTIPR